MEPGQSLRAKLIVSHVLVILIALTLLLVIGGAYVRREETHARTQRVQDAVNSIAVSVEGGNGRGAFGFGRLEALDSLADRLDVRVFVYTSNGLVVHDSAITGNLAGGFVPPDLGEFRQIELGTTSSFAGTDSGTESGLLTVSTNPDSSSDASAGGTDADSNQLFLGVTESGGRSPILPRLTTRLIAASAIALLVASAAGYWLSNRISTPIGRLTAAADGMASGKLRQQVPGAGSDDIGRLVTSFNAMSARIADIDTSQRQLLSDVAHQLRTPLTSIQGYSQALQDDVTTTPDDRQAALSILRHEADRMSRLIAQMLDLSRIDSGSAAIVMEPVDLHLLVSGAETRFAHEAAERGISLVVRSQPDTLILVDADRIDQIIDNLTSNALRHTPLGGQVTIEAYSTSNGEQGRTITLAVEDNGSGIDDETLPRLFDRFQRGPNGGSGLGMAIVREAAQLHEATIEVQTRPGAGTRVEVNFPALAMT